MSTGMYEESEKLGLMGFAALMQSSTERVSGHAVRAEMAGLL